MFNDRSSEFLADFRRPATRCGAAILMIALLTLATVLPAFDLAAYERPRLEKAAIVALAAAPKTIVTAQNPRSAGGLHDFSSEGDYWWPDPKDANAPYIQRDGLTNPDNFVAHRQLLLAFVRHFGVLAATYQVTGEERYAVAAVRHLHAWFVDPTTKMNPNLLYSQAIKGRTTGRSIGVIDTVHLAEVALGVEALRNSKALTKAEDAGVTGWFREYLTWIRTHPYGVEESNAKNNHGTCWTLQAACFARLVSDQAVLSECRQRLTKAHLPNQMAIDGSFPQEVARTKPYGYSIFNLDVMTGLAVALSTPTDNLMTFALPDGRSLVRGVEWLAPFLADKDAWLKTVRKPTTPTAAQADSKDSIKPDVMYWSDWPVRQPLLVFGALASTHSDRGAWLETWKKLNADPTVDEIIRNLPVRQPVLWVR